jgi:hypothetical protein
MASYLKGKQMEAKLKKAVSAVLTAVLLAGLSGCCEKHRSDAGKSLRLSPIYQSAINGAIIGGIIGYQSEEAGEGAALGAVIFGVGALLGEIDKANKDDECEDEDDDEEDEEVVFQIRNDNGSETAVVLKKSGGTYIGPKGEQYDRLPAAVQLKQKYGS